MANKIDTSQIVDPNTLQPFTGRSLQFLQDATQEQINHLANAMFTNGDDSGGGAKALWGVEEFDLGGNSFNFTAGAVWYQGEINTMDSVVITINDTAVVNIVTTNDPTADPLTFTDAVQRDVHNIRKMVVSDGASGSGEFNFSVITNILNVLDIWHEVGAAGEPVFKNSWVNQGGNDLRFSKRSAHIPIQQVHLRGLVDDGASGSVVFTLPGGYRPLNLTTITLNVGVFTGETAVAQIETGGDVRIFYSGGSEPISFDGVSFWIDN